MRAHGTRAKYVAEKCRCKPCTLANRAYSRQRERKAAAIRYGFEVERPAYVDATEAMEHLRWLSTVGVGKHVVAERSGVALSTIQNLRKGISVRCRQETADAILKVGRFDAAPGAYIDAGPTWKLLNELIANGYPKRQLAIMLGAKAKRPALQIGRRHVRAETAAQVKDLHFRLMFRVIEARRMEAERQAKYRTFRKQAA